MGDGLRCLLVIVVAVPCALLGIKFPPFAWTLGWCSALTCGYIVGYRRAWIAPAGAAMPAPTRPVPPMPECKPPRVEQADRIQAMHLAAGDTLVLNVDRLITKDQHAAIKASALNCIPDGCKVMVMHSGMSIAGTISAKPDADPIAASIARLDAHNLT